MIQYKCAIFRENKMPVFENGELLLIGFLSVVAFLLMLIKHKRYNYSCTSPTRNDNTYYICKQNLSPLTFNMKRLKF